MQNGAKESTSVSLPGWIIEKTDQYAKKKFMSRSDYVCRALRIAFALEIVDDYAHWEKVSQGDEEKS